MLMFSEVSWALGWSLALMLSFMPSSPGPRQLRTASGLVLANPLLFVHRPDPWEPSGHVSDYSL